MAKNHSGQMALYEVVNKERFKAAQKKELSRLDQDKAGKAPPVQPMQPVAIPPQQQQPKNAEVKGNVWTKKPKMFGLNSGRVEAFVPYPIAVTVLMGLALLLVISFRVGQGFGRHEAGGTADSKIAEKSSETTVSVDTAKVAKEMARSVVGKRVTPAQAVTTVGAESAKGGEFVIVLKELATSRDLEPAKQFFDEHGIQTEIKKFKNSYFLVTKEKYDSLSPGTPGYGVSEKIKKIGASYKPPEGYNGFAPHMFNDVYGKKI